MRCAHCSGEGCRDCDNFHIKFKPEIPERELCTVDSFFDGLMRSCFGPGHMITKGGKEHGDQQRKESN